MALWRSVPIPELGPRLPQRGNALSRGFGRLGLRVLGWGIGTEVPDVERSVAIVAPHTSNWDFAVGVLALLAMGLDAHWLGKHQIFRWPFGVVWRWLGGIPVDRRAAGGAVAAAVRLYRERPRLMLGLSPEGTRKRVEKWKSGFYRIALEATVPILPVAFDYRTRRIVFFPLLVPSGDLDADIDRLRSCFTAAMAREPNQYQE
ncbi:MAG TPA: 1-acyl-sn-glycerol-3-phosphate acyltransferase [Vicinamibacteria bacterium]|nr:1-acyl-sn-glycerol-3-phosphate acyltransferase [Vicinamibacteria bacterium]